MKVYQFCCAIFLGLGLISFNLIMSPASVQADDGAALLQKFTQTTGSSGPVTPHVYAAVLGGNVPVYTSPWDMVADLPPVRYLAQGYLWVSLSDSRPLTWGNYSWYQINPNEYVSAEYLSVYAPSTFQGLSFLKPPDNPIAWVVSNTPVSAAPGEDPAPDAPILYRYEQAIIYDQQQVDEQTWYQVTENQWVKAQHLGVVFSATRPAGVGENERWIEVNLHEQTVAAYEGGRLVYATLASSGLAQWPTVKGLFRIWTKVGQGKMSGRSGFPDYYYLEDVPWTMYFHQGYALHGTYWHNNFGFQHSHGCVNLAPQDARWLYNWATPTAGKKNWTKASQDNPGTWIWVH